ncbi:MAG: response regulator [Nitrospinae bacterium]|nr:response regulator [Nitrospinota bacterium]
MDNQSHIIKVLVVEDNPGDVRLIQEMLKEGDYFRFKLTCVERLDEAIKQLDGEVFDVLLLDLGLPDSQKLDTLKNVNYKAPHLPIVVITGLANEMLGIEAVREGAQDYLTKGQIDSNLLIHSIRYSIERKRMENEIKEKLDTIEKMNKLMVGRELRMEELRKENERLRERIRELEKA